VDSVQQVNNLEELLRGIFENKEIYATIQIEHDIEQISTMSGQSFMAYRGPARCKLELKVKMRKFDFINCHPKWDEAIIMRLIGDCGAFIARFQNHSPYDDMMINYRFDIFDMEKFKLNVTKYSEKLYQERFTKELEDKLSED
jgi:hypothetical protein